MNEVSNIYFSKREIDVLYLIAKEYTIDEIARSLFIGKETVKTHRKKMMSKLDAHSAVGIVVKAVQKGFYQL